MKNTVLILLIFIINTCYSIQFVLTVRNQTVAGNSVTFDLYIRTTNASDTIFLASSSWGWLFNSGNFLNAQFSVDSGSSQNIKNRAGQEVEDLYYTLDVGINGNHLTSDLSGPDPPNVNAFNQKVARISNQQLYHKIGRYRITGISNFNGFLGLQWFASYVGVWSYQTVSPYNVFMVNGTLDSIPNLLLPVKLINQHVPKNFNLYQNYPNPFNPSTTITFDISSYSKVVLEIYDMNGKIIARLFDGNLDAGTYNVKWDAEKFSTGIYFYRITYGNYTDVRKMIFLK